MFYTGVVENRSDPLQLGRCQVRIVGLHTHDKTQLPTNDLPWSTPIQPVTSAAMNGIGFTPVGPVEGTTVIIMFADEEMQQPIMLGTVGGIPSTPPAIDDTDAVNAAPKIPTKDITLRTIAGPVTGKQLTFVDKEGGSTNLTSGLKANMKVIGFGLSESCSIVSVDSPTQITISEVVTNYQENIITFQDPPTNLAEVNASKASSILTTATGAPVLDGSGTPVQAVPAVVASTPTNNSIPTIPPPKKSSNASKASAGIKALIAACDKVGLTTKEQKCALLGIAGGESGWIPQQEGYNYSPTRLAQIFTVTQAEIDKYSNAAQKGMTREEFFSWIYGPTKRGKGFLGHKTDAEGGMYYGRGFIQLTGKSNYVRYNDLAKKMGLNIDIVNNPNSLDDDINVSAIVAALYILDRVPKGTNPSAHPGYFYAAKNAVGKNSPDIAARKLEYYEYFYGASAGGAVEKSAGAPIPEPPKDGSPVTPGPSPDSIARGTDNTGFRDPNNKYPLSNYINEPDTNRLARGIIDGTIVKNKDAGRKRGVPSANGQASWDQPLSAFGAQYPYNKVLETESGHIQEWDDTPGQERIHTYHRAGTYSEVDPNGSRTDYIIGENYIIMNRNGYISVSGDCNLTVAGNVNIYTQSDANIQVEGDATVNVGNNLELNVANDLDLAVGGDISILGGGSLNVSLAGQSNIGAAAGFTFKSGAEFAVQTAQDISLNSGGKLFGQAASDINMLAGGSSYTQAKGGDISLKASGKFASDGSSSLMQSGASSVAAPAGSVEDISLSLSIPAAGHPIYPSVPQLEPPERQVEESAAIETPEDYNTPEGRRYSDEQSRTHGDPNAPAAVVGDAVAVTAPSGVKSVPVDCKIIYNTTNFTNDYRLSPNFTLGMVIDGGVGGKHKLVDQLLIDNTTGKERMYTVQEIVCNLAMTCQNVLEKYLEAGVLPGGIGGLGKQWKISSGYRLMGVIRQETKNSDHCKGHCIDIGLLGADRINRTYDLIQKMQKVIDYDQLILEYRYEGQVWTHQSWKSTGNRRMAFTMVNDKTYQRNSFVLIPEGAPPTAAPAK